MKKLFVVMIMALSACNADYTVRLKDHRLITVTDNILPARYKPGDSIFVRSVPHADYAIWVIVEYNLPDTVVFDMDGDPVEWHRGIVINKK